MHSPLTQADLRSAIPEFSWRAVFPAIQRALGRFAFVGMSPILAFYTAFRAFGPVEGMIAGTVTATVVLLIQAYRTRRLDPIGIVPVGAVLIQGAVGIAFQSVDLYLAAPALETALWGVVLLVSVALGRPIILLAASELKLLPAPIRRAPTVQRAFSQITVIWGLMAFVKSATRLLLLDALPLEIFLIANTVIITSMNVVLVAFTFWFALRAARRASAPDTRVIPVG
ncbi:MAG: VC0807 family protein [Chloroflexota bacterium]